MCVRQLFILLVLPLTTFLGCGEGRGHGEPNHHAHDASTDNHGHSHDDQDDIPHPYKGKANPNLSQHEEGRTLWLQHCSSCHGEGGAGDGPVSQGHDPAPTNFTVSGVVASMRDDYLLWRISEGGMTPPCQPTKRLSRKKRSGRSSISSALSNKTDDSLLDREPKQKRVWGHPKRAFVGALYELVLPMPASWSDACVMPPLQQASRSPSTATAGTVLTPN